MVRLVVLSACDSGSLGALGNQLGSIAQALHCCGFAAVMAASSPLSVRGSLTFTSSFYDELLRVPASLETAFLTARKRMAHSEAEQPRAGRPLDWANLQLYARHEDGDDTRPIVLRPFRGLLAFWPQHRRFFFGREREVQELRGGLQTLIEQQKPRFLIVAGASGTGKSSLVLAGVVPRLLDADPRLTVLTMRPGGAPERALDEALAQWPKGTPALLMARRHNPRIRCWGLPACHGNLGLRCRHDRVIGSIKCMCWRLPWGLALPAKCFGLGTGFPSAPWRLSC